MKTPALFYKINKNNVTTSDYIRWSHHFLENNISSPSLSILSSFSNRENIFEVEAYFKRALDELVIEGPCFSECVRGYIGFLAGEIMKADSHAHIFALAREIFLIVATELDYPDDLMEWYKISEMIDRLQYDEESMDVVEEDVLFIIREEAKRSSGYL
ncbi:hypothetical protein JOC95_001516 [Bacillus tianshenii]|uniref:Uncharacterized protein n=1 Tax=Sutcliffiella tianshenii TaxID=1463404 RepID=A0ABS2NYB9_9BACI|nr:hypothetical protein [Bacillus tianshenii]MBM7619664.1 hypothetical protein [Bacillus tianshenii]